MISGLLHPSPTARLRFVQRNIPQHPWFHGVDWGLLERSRAVPAPAVTSLLRSVKPQHDQPDELFSPDVAAYEVGPFLHPSDS